MSTGKRLLLGNAKVLALELVEILGPATERIEIAGSIRRQRADVGDVELIVIPRFETVVSVIDMFGSEQATVQSEFDRLCDELLERQVLTHRLNADGRKAWGPQLKWGMYAGFAVDLYCATPETWAVTMLIRTGPADFSKRLVTDRRHGGLCSSHLHFKDWRLRRRGSEEPIDTPDEAAVFRALGYEFLPPEHRVPEARPRSLREVPS
jgi:DNA polymerase/3'-5' exonuclease PolX